MFFLFGSSEASDDTCLAQGMGCSSDHIRDRLGVTKQEVGIVISQYFVNQKREKEPYNNPGFKVRNPPLALRIRVSWIILRLPAVTPSRTLSPSHPTLP